MKFAHLADCHIGGWREEELKKLGIESFRYAINKCIEKNVGFVLIAGDLFNTSLPDITIIKETSKILSELKKKNIDCYIIPGSHDFSPSGKTMLDVLENSGLVKNVFKFKNNKLKFTEDKTKTKITGILGLRSGLEKEYFQNLEKEHLEKEQGFKIFMFHTLLEEYKPKDMESVEGESIKNFPKNFKYYAGGHVHYVKREEIKLKATECYFINAENKTPEKVEQEVLDTIKDYQDRIILIRVEGTLKSGKPSEINFRRIHEKLKDAYCILRNTNKLFSKELTEIEVDSASTEEIEKKVIEDSKKEFKELGNKELVSRLMNALDLEKDEGEKNSDFETRIISSGLDVLKI